MKKIFVCLSLAILCGLFQYSSANCNCAKGKSSHGAAQRCNHNNSHSSGGSSQNVYLVRTENNSFDEKFSDCSKHYMKTNTTVNYYSDGSKRTYVNSTIYNQDGSVIATDCSRVNHIFYKKEHYFIICKNNSHCSIIDSKGNEITKKKYSRIEELKENRFLVKYNKKFGIIDLKENDIVPIKYKKFEKINNEIFITKLNGYYGILDIENHTLVKNDCEKIKLLDNTILLKRYGKFGLCDLKGEIIYNTEFDKIKQLGEYILIKKDKKYQILDYKGNKISNIKYEKIKLKRNTLYGNNGKEWSEIKQDL